jgi:hypothetical protein
MFGQPEVQEKLQRFDALFSPFWITHHCPYLAPSDIYLFPKPKEHLRGHHHAGNDGVKTAFELWFRHKDAQFYRDGFTKLL